MRFRDLPKFISGGNYACDVPWSYLEGWLKGQIEDDTVIDLDPDFQRGHVWNDKKRIAYVEYVLRGGSAAKSLFWNCTGWDRGRRDSPLMIVDGKQRLEAVRRFLRNALPIFAWHDPKGFGWRYNDFEDRLGLGDACFRMHINNLETRREVLQFYLDLNSGGVVHSDSEINRVRDLLAKEPK